MHEAAKLATAAAGPERDVESPPSVAASRPGALSGAPASEIPSTKSQLALALHALPPTYLAPPPGLPHPPPALQSSLTATMIGAGGGAGVPGPGDLPGGQVMVHWTHSGPTVQGNPPDRPSTFPAGDDDEDPDDEDDELLTPPPPRERLSYTRYQLELLNGIYVSVRYPNSVQKQLIAKRVGISREQVKIWFQNRRRKDVVNSKSSTTSADDGKSPSSSQDPGSPATTTASTTSNTSPTSPSPSPSAQATGKGSNGGSQDGSKESPDEGEEGEGGQKSRMVPEVVVKGCIAELKRFSDERLKERKEKRKAKGKRRGHASSATAAAARAANAPLPGVGVVSSPPGQPISRLFQAYDMVAPPNKVTPTAAYLNTAANRFNHSHNTSAFSSPRDHLAIASTMPRLAWDGLDTGHGLTQPLGVGLTDQLAHSRGYGGLGMAGLGMTFLPPTSQPHGAPGSQDTNLPVLSDLLGCRQPLVEGGASRDRSEASLPQPSFLGSGAGSSRADLAGKLQEMGGHSVPVHLNSMNPINSPPSVPTSSLGLGRVYPFPFIADPPIMLSSLHQQDPLRHAHHWPHPHPAPPPAPSSHFSPMVSMSGMDPYKPVVISSLSNPFFSHPAHPSHWPPQPGSDPAPGSGFPQH